MKLNLTREQAESWKEIHSRGDLPLASFDSVFDDWLAMHDLLIAVDKIIAWAEMPDEYKEED